MADGRVAWLLEVSIKADRTEEFTELKVEMVASTGAEPGTVGYEWSLGEDGRRVHILEQFADSDAALAHLGGFGAYAARFLDLLEVTSLTVYGAPDEAVREGLAGFAPVFMEPVGGFARGPLAGGPPEDG